MSRFERFEATMPGGAPGAAPRRYSAWIPRHHPHHCLAEVIGQGAEDTHGLIFLCGLRSQIWQPSGKTEQRDRILPQAFRDPDNGLYLA
jgi:hypothetical protein